jgi:hypothetical protein
VSRSQRHWTPEQRRLKSGAYTMCFAPGTLVVLKQRAVGFEKYLFQIPKRFRGLAAIFYSGNFVESKNFGRNSKKTRALLVGKKSKKRWLLDFFLRKNLIAKHTLFRP